MTLRVFLPLLVLLPGCCCVVPRTTVTQPAATFTVTDAAGTPLPDCDVACHWWSDPHSMWHGTTVQTTDSSGTVTFDEVTEQETIMPLMMHGVPWHSFSWGVECAGYTSQIGSFSLVEPGDAFTVAVAMNPGTATPVDDFDQFPGSYSTYPKGTDGKTGGPVEASPPGQPGDDDSSH